MPPHPSVPPPLIGLPENHSSLSNDVRVEAGREWLDWWERVLLFETRNTRSSVSALRGKGLLGRRDIFDWPELRALASWPSLWRAAVETGGAARTFRPATPPGTRSLAVDVRAVAEGLIEQLEVSPDRLRAGVVVLGVEGSWWYSPSPGALVCSIAVSQDGAQMASLLRSVLQAGLGD